MQSSVLDFPFLWSFLESLQGKPIDEELTRELQLMLVLEHARIGDYLVHGGKPTE